MLHLTDELLVAYADGELSRESASWVEAELMRNPQARKRLDAFQQVSGLVLKAHRTAGQAGRRVETAPAVWMRPAGYARAGLAFACIAGLLWVGGDLVSHDTGSQNTQQAAVSHSAPSETEEASRVDPSGDVVMAAWLRGTHAAPYR